MNVLDLFSGIGGFSLGLERAGMRTVAFCEIDTYCRRVLRKHWPHVPIYHDVRELRGTAVGPVDVICGGFPCQDISVAGKGGGIDGARSGLWSEYARIIGELRPRYVIVENVSALLGRGLDRVLGDLAEIGFDAEWHCIPASAVGAPHRRDRVWIMAYPKQSGEGRGGISRPGENQEAVGGGPPNQSFGTSQDVADANGADVEGQRFTFRIPVERSAAGGSSWWSIEPNVGRVAHGVPARVDRLRSLGNAVVPQIPEIIGRAIMMHALTADQHA